MKTNKFGQNIAAIGEKKMKKHAYIEFRERVEKALQGEKDGLSWDQLKKKGEIEQTRLCYTWARQLESEIGLIRERRGRNVYWKLEKI
jgi:hypothetical protein